MNLTQLRYFVAAAELENLSLAATRLRIAQSAVSRQIRLLEDELGVQLLERVGRGVVLTDAGKTLLDGSKQLFENVEQLRLEVSNRSRVPSGTLRIGANPSLGHVLFPRLAEQCLASYPAIKLHMVTDLTSPVQEWVRRGDLDLAIISFPERDTELVSTPLSREAIYLISARGHDPGLGSKCSIKDVARLGLILPGLPNRERLGYERLAVSTGFSLNCHIESDSLPVMKSLARHGLGHLLLPYIAIGDDQPPGQWSASQVVELDLERHVLRSAKRPVTGAMAVVLGLIEAEIGRLRRAGIIR